MSYIEQNSVYEKIDLEKLDILQKKHQWIVEPIYNASEYVKTTPFYKWIENIDSPQSFKDVAIPLYYHSATFPKVMGLMLGLTPLSENSMMPFYAKHAYGEADHHEMLMKWMLKNKLLDNRDDYFDVHVEADEHHSIMGLEYIACQNADSTRGKELIAKALEGIELWGKMINSWIGVNLNCKFQLDGTLVRNH